MTGPVDHPTPSLLPLLGALASQVAFVTAVLYYFGWAHHRAFYGHFGVPAAMLGFTTQDYVLASLSAMFVPVLVTLLIALALLPLHRVPAVHARRTARPRRTLRGWVLGLAVTGGSLTVLVAVAALIPTPLAAPLATPGPVLLVAGAAFSACALGLRWRHRFLIGSAHASRVATRAGVLALVSIAVIGYIWAVAAYGERKGAREAAHAEAAHFIDRPTVLVFSTERLALEGAGTQVGEISAPGERYRYVYSGLWLLARAGDRWYLLPQQWQRGRDRVFLLEDDESVRVDLGRNP